MDCKSKSLLSDNMTPVSSINRMCYGTGRASETSGDCALSLSVGAHLSNLSNYVFGKNRVDVIFSNYSNVPPLGYFIVAVDLVVSKKEMIKPQAKRHITMMQYAIPLRIIWNWFSRSINVGASMRGHYYAPSIFHPYLNGASTVPCNSAVPELAWTKMRHMRRNWSVFAFRKQSVDECFIKPESHHPIRSGESPFLNFSQFTFFTWRSVVDKVSALSNRLRAAYQAFNGPKSPATFNAVQTSYDDGSVDLTNPVENLLSGHKSISFVGVFLHFLNRALGQANNIRKRNDIANSCRPACDLPVCILNNADGKQVGFWVFGIDQLAGYLKTLLGRFFEILRSVVGRIILFSHSISSLISFTVPWPTAAKLVGLFIVPDPSKESTHFGAGLGCVSSGSNLCCGLLPVFNL